MPAHYNLADAASAVTGAPYSAAVAAVTGMAHENHEQSVDFSNLYPAVIECFAIILCGYVAGRSNIISQTEAKGLNTFVSYFSLPALIFMSMAKLDFSSVNWLFLLAICLAKSVVFALVAIITMLVQRPTDYSKAGLYAIFCTQSNDFALGYPILVALYGKTHPEFPAYLYLLAPISLVLLNPIGFMLMEIGKSVKQQRDSRSLNRQSESRGRDTDSVSSTTSSTTSSNTNSNTSSNNTSNISSSSNRTARRCCFAGRILQGILLNPVVMMTLLGIVGNLVFNHELPAQLHGVLLVLGQAFSATALFSLGVRMVGKVATLRGSSLVLPGILIAVKTIMLPLVCREFVSLLKPGGASHNATEDYSNYGFLYGTFPTAPSVFVYAAHYNIQPDLIASSMVAVTFLSAPLMLVSAKMVALVHINPLDYVKELEAFLFHVSIVGLIASLWVVAVFVLSRKWRKVPHCITLCLAIAQCMASTGALLWSVMDCTSPWKLYLQFTLVTWGVFASRFFTALLAATLFLLRWRSLCFVLSLRPFLAVLGWCVPGALVLVLVLVVQREMTISDKADPNFQYGTTQAVVALLLLWFTLFTTIVCLILQQRQQKRYHSYSPLSDAHHSDDLTPLNRSTDGERGRGGEGVGLMASDCSELDDIASTDSADSLFSPNDDLRPAASSTQCRGNTAGLSCSLDQCNGDAQTTASASSRTSKLAEKPPVLVPLSPDAVTATIIDVDTKLVDDTSCGTTGAAAGKGGGGGADAGRGAGGGGVSEANGSAFGGGLPRATDTKGLSKEEEAGLSSPSKVAPAVAAGNGVVNDKTGRLLNASVTGETSLTPAPAAPLSSVTTARQRHGVGSATGGGASSSSSRRHQQHQRSAAHLTQPQESIILRDRDDEFQMMRHVVLLLFLCGSMIVGFGLCLWTLVSEEVSGVYVEMVFLDAVLNYGQGLITAVIFGLDTKLIVLPLLRWYQRLVYGATTLQLPSPESLPLDDRQTCEQFTRYHMDKCYRDLVRDRRWRLRQMTGVFGGQELVDWLLLVGLANDRTHAVRYGRALLAGRVIRHTDDLYHFHDQPLFYAFCQPQQQGEEGDLAAHTTVEGLDAME